VWQRPARARKVCAHKGTEPVREAEPPPLCSWIYLRRFRCVPPRAPGLRPPTRSILGDLDDLADSFLRLGKHHVRPLARVLLLSTFIEDGFRMFTQVRPPLPATHGLGHAPCLAAQPRAMPCCAARVTHGQPQAPVRRVDRYDGRMCSRRHVSMP